MDQQGNPSLDWQGTVPVSTRFGDSYFSRNGGLEEARHVFLAGNSLPQRFAPGFHIAELGFGTGLNMLAAWAAWEASGQNGALNFTSFEAYPMALTDMNTALINFPEVADHTCRFLSAARNNPAQVKLDTLNLNILIGDANQTLPNWNGRADAWFLDGFSPAKNPEMWGEELLMQVAQHTQKTGTCATYSAAGVVRRGLTAAGFDVSRQAGFAGKRHMTCGVKR